MKNKLLIGLIGLSLFQIALAQQSMNWNNSPDNWQNSSNNWENSPQNWKNSPQNWSNSPNNFGATNGVFDSQGRQVGYEVQAPSGVTNIYSNNGQRLGYVPARPR